MESLQIGKTRLYDLRTSYLAARAEGKGDDWTPGVSGGNHMPEWPDDVQRFLKKVLGPDGDAKRYSYAFAASEVGRKFDMSIDRSQVRHWANEHGLHTVDYRVRPVAHVRRWQRKAIGELWQLDATPDYFLGKDVPSLTLIDMLDDCSRMQVGDGFTSARRPLRILTSSTVRSTGLGSRWRSTWTRPRSSEMTMEP